MKKSAQIIIVCGLVVVGGCAAPKSGLNAALPSAGAGRAALKQAAKDIILPGAVQGTGWHIPWYAPDPKNPTAPPRRVLVADARQGAMDSKTVGKQNVLTVHLRDVHATFYHEDQPSATLDAPFVTTNERDRILIATGGVTLHSVLDPMTAPGQKAKPSDTTVQADKIVWDSHTTQVVCTGNARLFQKNPGIQDIHSESNRILYNTATRHFHTD